MPAALRNATQNAQKPGADLLISRTATLDDPLTTSLLAEVTRRSPTIEVEPEQVDEALDIEPGDGEPDDSI
jgi:DNA-binding transcriptional LysR family regulator